VSVFLFRKWLDTAKAFEIDSQKFHLWHNRSIHRTDKEEKEMSVIGRFAPTPSGRMHAGNLLCALIAWLSARSVGGKILLRIEDLDTYRCGWEENSYQLINDLHFLGLTFDGGYDRNQWQSARFSIYQEQFEKLQKRSLLYPCTCSRAELHAATAPHLSDGSYRYDGKCYRRFLAGLPPYLLKEGKAPAYRIHVPDRVISFEDRLCGRYEENLEKDCGDFIIRRADGVYAYQLAVVTDDGLSGITQVVRGRDLLSSTPRQIWLAELLGFSSPQFCHIPLLTDSKGRRLSKRDGDLDIGSLRKRFGSPEPIIGMLGYCCSLLDRPEPVGVEELIPLFSFDKIPKEKIVFPDLNLLEK
jgi:glutamyl-tRNA synthetase